ncbi:AAA family ATPase [Methanospirillum hungatei]|uniref:ATP-binding protein n=1 Tax=Methanospirillum hungatei TaxID=2203 RepID=UPI0026F17376|nr:AAA family ATPase [Methanospirillum hungatei]MCA1915179.1 AAA family ATPase [Methanospirillum hungatei]
MEQKFRIGTDDFKELIDEKGYFIDKTLLIREIIDGNKVTLIPRPRRFGKTLNMTMLRYFFEKSEESRAYLFEGCAIADYPEYMQHQGQYPVIYISLKDLKRDSYVYFIKATKAEIGRLYREFLPISLSLPEASRARYLRICREESPDDELYNSLKELISHCYHFYKKPVIVLIDEYDTPMIEAFSNGYYDEMAGFMRSWLGAGLKPERGQVLYRAVVTGILRIANESIFSDLNNLDVASPLMVGPYADKFGFTSYEIDLILTAFHVEDHADIIRDWYNGYSFGGHTIYNPWSLISYIQAIPNPPGPKWLNTSSNALVYEELSAGGMEIKRDMELLLSGKELRYPLSETITFSDIGKNPVNIWSLLYYSGYLKAEDPRFAEYDPNLLTYALSIPNREIFLAYRQFVNHMFDAGSLSAGIKDFVSYFLEKKGSFCS